MIKLRAMSRREFFVAGAGMTGGAALSAGGMTRGGLLGSRGSARMAGSGQAQAAGPAAGSRVVLVRTDSRADGVKK